LSLEVSPNALWGILYVAVIVSLLLVVLLLTYLAINRSRRSVYKLIEKKLTSLEKRMDDLLKVPEEVENIFYQIENWVHSKSDQIELKFSGDIRIDPGGIISVEVGGKRYHKYVGGLRGVTVKRKGENSFLLSRSYSP